MIFLHKKEGEEFKIYYWLNMIMNNQKFKDLYKELKKKKENNKIELQRNLRLIEDQMRKVIIQSIKY